MNWGSFSEFAAMGGHGLYVWGSYAVAALCIVIEVAGLARRARAVARERAGTGGRP